LLLKDNEIVEISKEPEMWFGFYQKK